MTKTLYPARRLNYKIMSMCFRWWFNRLSEKNKLNLFDDVYHEELGFGWLKGNYYSSIRPDQLWYVLRKMKILPGDSFIDFGSGMGTAIIVASKLNFEELYGIELSRDLYKKSLENIEKLNIKNVNIINEDAIFVESALDKCNHFYFFNPFPPDVFLKVLHNIEKSLSRKKRPATLYYANPKFKDTDFDAIILNNSTFTKLFEFKFAKEIYVYHNDDYRARLKA